MSRFSLVCVLMGLAALVTVMLPSREPHASVGATRANVRVGLVFDVGGKGDKSFNDSAYAGLSKAQQDFGITVEVIEPSGAEDREAAMRLFAARGFDLVIGVGFIFSTDINIVSKAFPNTSFACVDYASMPGQPIGSNVAGLVFREEEGAFLIGAVAGLVSKSKAVGFVGGMQVPLIKKFEAGYRAGVRHVCPDCRVFAAYAGNTPEAFKDPAKGKAIATAHISAGADVVFHASGSTGLGVFEAARDMKAWAIGVDADQYDEMPGTVLTSMVKRVDVVVYDIVKELVDGKFHGGLHSFGLKDNGIDYVSEGPHASGIPDATRQTVNAIREQVADGTVTVELQ